MSNDHRAHVVVLHLEHVLLQPFLSDQGLLLCLSCKRCVNVILFFFLFCFLSVLFVDHQTM